MYISVSVSTSPEKVLNTFYMNLKAQCESESHSTALLLILKVW